MEVEEIARVLVHGHDRELLLNTSRSRRNIDCIVRDGEEVHEGGRKARQKKTLFSKKSQTDQEVEEDGGSKRRMS